MFTIDVQVLFSRESVGSYRGLLAPVATVGGPIYITIAPKLQLLSLSGAIIVFLAPILFGTNKFQSYIMVAL